MLQAIYRLAWRRVFKGRHAPFSQIRVTNFEMMKLVMKVYPTRFSIALSIAKNLRKLVLVIFC